MTVVRFLTVIEYQDGVNGTVRWETYINCNALTDAVLCK